MVTQVTKHDGGVTCITVTVIQSCDTKKNIKSSGINDIIQHDNNMLVL